MIAKNEDDLLRFAGLEVEPDLVRADGRPAMGDGIGQLTGFHGCGLVPAAVCAEKRLALGVKTSGGPRAGEIGEVVAALAVLRLVIDDAVFDLHLADGEVALEVGGVVLGIPQAELDAGEGGEASLASSGDS